MLTPKGWTSYTGGIYSIELPSRDATKAKPEFRTKNLQDVLKRTKKKP